MSATIRYPIVGKIIVGRSIAQFSTKLKVEERLWHVKSGRAIGKSHAAAELDRLMTTSLKYATQSFVRDLLVFSTFTGISYADVKKLTWKDVITEDDGSLWIPTNKLGQVPRDLIIPRKYFSHKLVFLNFSHIKVLSLQRSV